MRFPPLAVWAAALAAALAADGHAEGAAEPAATGAPAPHAGADALAPSRDLAPLPRGEAPGARPAFIRAQRLQARPDLEAVAEGEVEFRRGPVVIRAERVEYDLPADRARVQGGVQFESEGVRVRGRELELLLQRQIGMLLAPDFDLLALGAGGRAERLDFLGPGRMATLNALYTSCPRDCPQEPDWVLQAERVHIDLDAGMGEADGAVLRFLGAPILALPAISFPLGETRKSGWLPPSFNIDNRSGVELAVPYYWNIAPHRDATLAPRLASRRGFGLDAEFRYLEPTFDGELRLDALPEDRLTGTSRGSLRWHHEARLPWSVRAQVDVARVADEQWWRDFPNRSLALTSRLLPSRLALERSIDGPAMEGVAYGRAGYWQVQQDAEAPIQSPYQRSPQVGLRLAGRLEHWQWNVEGEYNRFTLPGNDVSPVPRTTSGERVHLLAGIARPWRAPGWWVVPKLSLNAAQYDAASMAPGAGSTARAIPTFSVDAGLELEREAEAFGRRLHQTLEPRLVYVNTPYRAQSQYPSYDAWAKDFNFMSIYGDNAFSGVDRVADYHQITAGATTRLVDAASGAEALRLGLAQRYLLRPQQVAPGADGSPDGPPLEQRFSDALLLGSTSVLPGWTLDAAVQYSPEVQRAVRSILGARYSPGRLRTVGVGYRYTRGLTEQVALGWQWPLLERAVADRPAGGCGGSWYSVGRVAYSMKDNQITDAIAGLEYDAGCWIARFVLESQSIGRSEATTRVLLQLELAGLSRIGSNPLRVLKENVPGYQTLREERTP